MFDIGDLIFDLEDNSIFEEIPVDLDTFMQDGYLEQTGVTLSHYQKEMIEHMTQIYDFSTLVQLYGREEAQRRDTFTVREVICMLGKGSGKDYCAEIACAYLVYKLMCLKDPAKYFGKPPGDSFDIVNVAVNAEQARNVFFKGLSRLIKKSPWFAGKYHMRQRDIAFDKNITIYSGHSEAEAFEGLNLFMCVLDEIAGFEHYQSNEDEDSGKSPAQAIYDMYSASITSRFGSRGKIVLLSFPRAKGDFISQRYEAVIGEVNPIPMEHTFILNRKLPADTPGNSFTIQWTIDDIISYKRDDVWALRRPSWDVNPTKNIDDYIDEFFSEPVKSLGKFAAEPQESVGGFFDDHEKINEFSNFTNGLDERNVFLESFLPKDDTKYYIHVDLARKHDRCVVSMSHVANWRKKSTNMGDEFLPVVKVDFIRYWTPDRERQVDFMEVRDFIMSVIKRGFNVRKITFDQWQSDDMIKYFNRAGVEADILSVGLQHYMDLKMLIQDGRAEAPYNEILRRELKQVHITKNGKNVDHPRTKEGSKDISDSVAGSVFNAISLTPKPQNFEFEILDQDDFRTVNEPAPSRGIIDPPRADRDRMPDSIAEFIGLL